RDAAIQLLLEAIEQYEIEGVATTLPFGRFVLEHEAFTSGQFDTHFVQNYFKPEELAETDPISAEIAAQLAVKLYCDKQRLLKVPGGR
ncbi:hypothetical protein RZS08_39890, partial [Arthrospira platensis SPKY1]|nr:hypothetical protein [Arthrospira platensis SPKY1]